MKALGERGDLVVLVSSILPKYSFCFIKYIFFDIPLLSDNIYVLKVIPKSHERYTNKETN